MSGSKTTPPKGRATRARNDGGSRSRIPPMFQWALVVLVGLVILAAIFYFGRDVESDLSTLGVIAVRPSSLGAALGST